MGLVGLFVQFRVISWIESLCANDEPHRRHEVGTGGGSDRLTVLAISTVA